MLWYLLGLFRPLPIPEWEGKREGKENNRVKGRIINDK